MVMKKIKLLGILLLTGTLYAQQINLNNNNVIQPNYGLAITLQNRNYMCCSRIHRRGYYILDYAR